MGRLFYYKGMPFVADYGVQTCIEPICLDCETSFTNINGDYVTWITSAQVVWGNDYFIFGNAKDLCDWYNSIVKKYKLGLTSKGSLRRVITYIHNAKFDLSFLIPFFKAFLPDLVDDHGEPLTNEKGRPIVLGTLTLDEHEIIQYAQGCFLFRCSAKLTNKSLEKWGKDMNVKHKKKVGFYDYNKVRYPDEIDKLSDKELEYDKDDVLCLQESLKKQMLLNNEALASYNGKRVIPLTSTGYVRRDLAESCLNSPDYMSIFKESMLTGELYHACLSAYSGGYTHNNRFYANKLITIGKTYKCNNKTVKVDAIAHRDFTSFYPSQMKKMRYPLGKWFVYYDIEKYDVAPTLDEIVNLYPVQSALVYLRIHKAVLSDLNITMPFMQDCKLIYDRCDLKRKTCDNGRIIYIEFKDDKYCDVYLDNVTLSILNEQYEIDYQVLKVWTCANIPLPKEITNIIDKYFKGKSDKKNEWKKAVELYGEMSEQAQDKASQLAIQKSLLNSIYGVFATRIARENWQFNPKTLKFELPALYDLNDSKEEIANKILQFEYEAVEHYYESNKTYVPYVVGVFTTSFARKQLYDFVTKCIGYEHILYCDTDSAYYISTPEIEQHIDEMNKKNRKKAPYVVLDNGKKEFYDYFDKETDLKAFKGLHAKCYGYVNVNDEFKVTIAGVPAKTITGMDGDKPIYLTREDELRYYEDGIRVCTECSTIDALDKLQEGYVFHINKGMTAKYINYGKLKTFNIDGHKIITGGGCILRPPKEKNLKEFKILDFNNEI
ncbi:MAG: hypothetical protein J6S85_20260 [Methanobrevibacter sp.]|nr:hypothetical protein [Clostridia bacterium]MBO7715909.1 hypothetical protein [Methanobrevibacter sp.]